MFSVERPLKGIQFDSGDRGGSSPIDEIDAILGLSNDNEGTEGKKDEAEKKNIEPVLPTTDDIPEELRGKPVKEAIGKFRELQGNYTKVSQEKADLVRNLEASLSPGKGTGTSPSAESKVPGGPPPDLGVLYDEVVEAKLDRLLSGSELGKLAAPYREEMKALLNQVPDRNARVQSMALEAAARMVVGGHIDEIIKQEKTVSAPSLEVRNEAAGGVPKGEKTRVPLDDEQKRNLTAWFEGDMDAVKRSLTGGGNE